jgi:hypothetical protein
MSLFKARIAPKVLLPRERVEGGQKVVVAPKVTVTVRPHG